MKYSSLQFSEDFIDKYWFNLKKNCFEKFKVCNKRDIQLKTQEYLNVFYCITQPLMYKTVRKMLSLLFLRWLITGISFIVLSLMLKTFQAKRPMKCADEIWSQFYEKYWLYLKLHKSSCSESYLMKIFTITHHR